MSEESKHCPRCNETKPLTEFGICRARKDNLNLYCKRCIREKMAASRVEIRMMEEARRSAGYVSRKPLVVATRRQALRFIHRGDSSVEKVKRAIELGASTQRAIRLVTRLRGDAVTDALAVLVLDEGAVKPMPLPKQSFMSWHGENWKYEPRAA